MKEVAIKDICEKGSSALKQKELLPEGKYPVYGASGIAGYLDSYQQENEYIGIVKDGSGIGRVAFYPEKTSLIGTMQYILPKKGYNIRYIGYCLQSLDLSKYKQGAAIPHIYFSDYGERVVKVTSDVLEQNTIVQRLDVAFARIDTLKNNAEQQLSEARGLYNRAFTEEMKPKEGWKEMTLGEVCEIKSLLVNPKDNQYKELLHVGGANIVSLTGELVDLKTAEEEGLTSGKFTFDTNDVLYNKIRPYLIKVARPSFNGLCSADMYPLTPKQSITRGYLYYLLTSKDFTEYAILNSGRAGMPKINRQALFSYGFKLPPLLDQHTIVNYLDTLSVNVRQLEEVLQKTLAECDTLKQAMLREIFE